MKKPFYHHLLSFEEFDAEVGKLNASEDEKRHLCSLAEENIHITIMDLVMSELSPEDKKTFLKQVHEKNHDELWNLLKTKNTNIEEKITQEAKRLLEELKADIKQVQKGE